MIKNIYMLFLVAFISLYCCYWNVCNALDEKKNLIIRIEIEGNKFEKDLIQFIEGVEHRDKDTNNINPRNTKLQVSF